jgi:hypothetical protein
VRLNNHATYLDFSGEEGKLTRQLDILSMLERYEGLCIINPIVGSFIICAIKLLRFSAVKSSVWQKRDRYAMHNEITCVVSQTTPQRPESIRYLHGVVDEWLEIPSEGCTSYFVRIFAYTVLSRINGISYFTGLAVRVCGCKEGRLFVTKTIYGVVPKAK